MKIVPWDGKPISQPGCYSGISLEQYHSAGICDGPSISSSGLRAIFTHSPAKYWSDSPYNPEREDDDRDNDALEFGSAVHALVLGDEDFNTSYVMRPEKAPDGSPWNGNKTTCKEWIAAQEAKGRAVLSPSQMRAIRGIVRNLAKQPLVRAGALNGGIELSMFYLDEETGVWVRVRPDTIPYDSADVVDLKTSAKYGDDLDRTIFVNYRYDMQGGLVKMAMKRALGIEMASFTLMFVEKKAPYSVEAVTIDKADLESAEADIQIALKTFAHCYARKEWFGPGGTQFDARFAHKSEWAATRASYQRSVLEREIAQAQTETRD